MKILVTGCAGFIGYHVVLKLLSFNKNHIFGIDNLNDYYDVELKQSRLKNLKKNKKFSFKKLDINNNNLVKKLFNKNKFNVIIHLAAQAGVRYSIDNPKVYFDSNISGFFNIIENSRLNKVKHLVFASTSSVYGDSNKYPLKEEFSTDSPLSFYAASKKTNEIIAYSYSYIYKLPTTALRFFTVYGPLGRPDMSLFLFTKAMLNNKKLNIFNRGKHIRDFTYIDDVVESIFRIISKPSKKKVPYSVYNIGSNRPTKLMTFLKIISKIINKKPKIIYKPLQKGDVYKTHASVNRLYKTINYLPKTSIELGVKNFINWYKKYYK
ncbi:MAG: UDP-N-acetylglucosamine 4-epimerase [Alphaproteobacteria bacterium MarineAlpha5_Bin8]|nr:MAG: UDP-N-acetylglucosamine 4-epimerase [Alphaproteobacteria bacterium MarineAlpha5_Bin8]PPR54149.1 MAG: UDP-N-acetylglucosamine 4-epimerase [Alphaproteobacteria bacterium MarineAlpha5_Bin6]|tara:strand:- start:1778 stop:2743 length:966 start_codon:yes stop_codon:yes gene_type:complete